MLAIFAFGWAEFYKRAQLVIFGLVAFAYVFPRQLRVRIF
jgi:hypothetical protein